VTLAFSYAARDLVVHLDTLPGSRYGAWLENWLFPVNAVMLAFLLLLFPDGHRPSRRWRPVAFTLGISWSLLIIGAMFTPNPLQLADVTVQNPLGLSLFARPPLDRLVRGPSAIVNGLLFIAAVGSLICAAAAPFVKYRSADAEERLQLRWFAYVCTAIAAVGIVAALVNSVSDTAATALFSVAVFGIAVGVPVTVGIAVLKYRLYEIDVVVRKTVVVAVLAIFITVVYVAIVVGIGAAFSDTLALQIVATAIVALAFQPVRRWAERLANRLVYGRRAEPYEVLARFADRIGDTYASEDVIGRIARVIADGTGSARTEVWLRLGDELRRSGSWPASEPHSLPCPDGELPELEGDRVAAVRHLGELLGAITITKPPTEQLTPNEAELLDRLADQSGLVLANVRLTADLEARLEQIDAQAAELRASRQRIVAAQDEERRRLERNIHDGAQQHLVALAVKLRLARSMLERDPERGLAMLTEIATEIDAARDTIHSLSLGIYPPRLEQEGIAAALAAQFERSDLPVRMDAGALARHPLDIEAAVYFCVLEALQNAAKYAGASRIDVRLRDAGGAITFEVRDDGRGFDPSSNGVGTGLAGMRDRLAVFGGSAAIRSAPGAGTIVTGGVPLPSEVSA
jgi:signal transduction histidine kinase